MTSRGARESAFASMTCLATRAGLCQRRIAQLRASADALASRVVADHPVFYFDFNSPYAYLATMRMEELIPDAEWRPIAYPILLNQLGRLESAMQRDFGAAVAEASGRAAKRGLPAVNPPQGWPAETWSLAPLRAALFADDQGRLREFSRAAYCKLFVDGRSLAEIDNIREAARETDLDPDEVQDAMQRLDIKQRLKDQTEEALARGVSGIPTVAIGNELFWGDDHLEEAAAAAGAARS
jgi:2-hydroxychromene-2-carboxylate isomerase